MARTRDNGGDRARLLQLSVVALGASVSLTEVLAVAHDSLPIMVSTVVGGLLWMLYVSRRLKVDRNTTGLLAEETSICGASAIASVAPVLSATAAETGYAISIVFLFNFVAVLTFPTVAHLVGMGPSVFAVWADTAINDTSSVLAASLAFGPAIVARAAVVKLARTMMILPTTLLLSLFVHRGAPGRTRDRLSFAARRAVPWFAVAFILGSMANSAGLIPPVAAQQLARTASVGSVLALAAIGLSTDIDHIRQSGFRPIVLAGAGWLLIAALSLLAQRIGSA